MGLRIGGTWTVCRFKGGCGVFEGGRWGDTPMHTMIRFLFIRIVHHGTKTLILQKVLMFNSSCEFSLNSLKIPRKII